MSAGPKVTPLAELCAELDALEEAAGERVGGPTHEDWERIRTLEADIGARQADSVPVALWRARRLARAVTDRWRDDFVEALARAVQRDDAGHR